jgi:hypothetical protein
MFELAGKDLFKSLTRSKLISYFGDSKVSTEQIIEWAKKSNYVSVYALDPLKRVFISHKAHNSQYCLVLVVNNDHLYPIVDADTKKSVVLSGKLDLGEYKFNVVYDDIQYVEYDKNLCLNIDESKKVILFEDVKSLEENLLINLMNEVCHSTKTNIDHIKFNNGKPTAFKHPITSQIYEITTKYEQRYNIIDILKNKYGSSVVQFQNQSYTQIGQIIFDNEFGITKQLKSNLSHNIFEIFETYKIGPYCASNVENLDKVNEDDCFGFDVCKSYSSVLLNNQDDFAIFQEFDEPQIFDETFKIIVGEYYIDKQIVLCDGSMIYPNGYYPSNFVKFLLNKKIITKKDIKFYIPAKQFINANTFQEFVKHIYLNYPEDAKQLINNFIGDLGTKYIKTDQGCITSSFDIATSILLSEESKNRSNVMIDSLNDLHFVRIQTKAPRYNNGLPIHRHIICGGIINLINLYEKVKSPDNSVICYNTDSIMIQGEPNENLNKFMVDIESTNILNDIGRIRNEDVKLRGRYFQTIESKKPIYELKKLNWNITEEGQDNFNEFV